MEAKDAIMRIKDFGLHHAIEDLPKSTLTVEAFNKAIELLRLEESGKLIVLPCKIGDIVNNFNEDNEIVSMTITEIYPFGESSFDCESQLPTIHNICLEDEDWNEYYLSFEDFNISINEAEEKLKEMNK